jgi:hypothetical protein
VQMWWDRNWLAAAFLFFVFCVLLSSVNLEVCTCHASRLCIRICSGEVNTGSKEITPPSLARLVSLAPGAYRNRRKAFIQQIMTLPHWLHVRSGHIRLVILNYHEQTTGANRSTAESTFESLRNRTRGRNGITSRQQRAWECPDRGVDRSS